MEKLGIELKDFKNYFEQVTPQNKDFIVKKGISTLAENTTKINEIVSNPEEKYKILACLNDTNTKVLNDILDNPKKYNLKVIDDIIEHLK